MQINRPTWYLKTICPDCKQGYPSFCICTVCGYLTVMCEETGNTFINAKNLEQGFTNLCPKCKKNSTAEFITATSENILEAGFIKDEYE